MAKLPNIDQAIIDDRKITHYLLNRDYRFGGPKAVIFESFGFTADDWHLLRDALLDNAQHNDIHRNYLDRYGQVYEAIDPIETPNGRNPTILVAWMIRHDEDVPRLVTAVPS